MFLLTYKKNHLLLSNSHFLKPIVYLLFNHYYFSFLFFKNISECVLIFFHIIIFFMVIIIINKIIKFIKNMLKKSLQINNL